MDRGLLMKWGCPPYGERTGMFSESVWPVRQEARLFIGLGGRSGSMKFAKLPAAVLLLAMVAVPSCEKAAEKATELAGKLGSLKKKEDSTIPEHDTTLPPPKLGKLKEKRQTSLSMEPAAPVVRNLSEGDYEAFIASPGKLVVVDYHAGWCGPCKMLSPVLERLAEESGGQVALGKIDVDANPALAEKAGVRSIPDVRVFRDGKQVDRFIGILEQRKIKQMFVKHSRGLDAKAPVSADGGMTPAAVGAQPTSEGAAGTFQRMDKNWMPPGIQKR